MTRLSPNVVPPRPVAAGRRFGCPLCPDRFAVLGDKKRHIRETHPKETP